MNYRNLKIWMKSMDIIEETYRVTHDFPATERFGLVGQMRRCSISLASNIAEGAGRGSKNEFRQFISYTIGSLYELETQVEASKRIGMSNDLTTLEALLFEFRKMIHSFQKQLKN